MQLGICMDLEGNDLDSGSYFLCLTALPMGFSFSFWIVQELHYDALKNCGFPASRCVLGNWPTPSLEEGPVALAYCDNLNIFGKDPVQVDHALSVVMSFLESKGFALHEVVYATPWSKPLGSSFNGYDNLLGSRPDKAWTIQGALKWFGQGPRVSGKQVEIILGHFTHESLYARGALSVFRAAYTFIRDSYHTRQFLWPSVRREMLVAAGLMPLLVAHLDLPWSPFVHTTDACMSGWGSCKGWVGAEVAKNHGQWSERWRFRRLTPEEWCPRRRALPDPSLHDLYTDPRTLGDQSVVYQHYFGIEDADLQEGAEPSPSHLDWRMHEGFPEVGDVSSWGWRVTSSGKFHFAESIGVKEARAVVYDLESQLRDPKQHRFKHLRLIDNFGDSLCLARGRASDYALLQLCRRYGALLLATGAIVSLRWVPSENNPADAPSRRYEDEAPRQLALYAKSKTAGAGPTSGEAVRMLRHNEHGWNQAAHRLCAIIQEPSQASSPSPVKKPPLPCNPQGPHRRKGFVQCDRDARCTDNPGEAFTPSPFRHVDTRGSGFGDSHRSKAVSKVVRRLQSLCDKRKSICQRLDHESTHASVAPKTSASVSAPTCKSSFGLSGPMTHRDQSYVSGEVAYIDIRPPSLDPPSSRVYSPAISTCRPSCESRDISALNSIDTRSGTSATRSHGFLHRHSDPQRVKVVEWCAGTSRVAGACAAVGLPSESFEISRDVLEDVLSRHVKSRLRHLIQHRRLRLLWIGIPCGSFSRARRGKKGGGGWPPPLRGDSPPDIFGLPHLSEKDQQRVRIGNRLAKEMCVLIKLCIRCKVPVVVENPSLSRLFLFPALRKLISKSSGNIVFHQCQYGSNFKKPTRLVAWNFDISSLCKVCTGSAKLCSLSHLPHTPLVGTKGKEGFWTAVASAYPEALCRRVASVVSDGKSGIPQ